MPPGAVKIIYEVAIFTGTRETKRKMHHITGDKKHRGVKKKP